jgi:3-methyladenine DNA glycosylase AlkD
VNWASHARQDCRISVAKLFDLTVQEEKAMQLNEAMAALEKAGTAQYRKIYARHGIGENMFGVSYATLKSLVKQIKKDQPLAEQLWATGNHDARILATMIADPATISSKVIDQWVKEIDNYAITDAVVGVVSKSAVARQRMEKWQKSKDEWIGRAGWMLLAHLAMSDQTLSDDDLASFIPIIESEIHARKNRVRDAMNSALISIGIRNAALEKQALAAAKRIGRVEVDHGETNCQTPDAAEYIRKVAERHQKRHAANVRK